MTLSTLVALCDNWSLFPFVVVVVTHVADDVCPSSTPPCYWETESCVTQQKKTRIPHCELFDHVTKSRAGSCEKEIDL